VYVAKCYFLDALCSYFCLCQDQEDGTLGFEWYNSDSDVWELLTVKIVEGVEVIQPKWEPEEGSGSKDVESSGDRAEENKDTKREKSGADRSGKYDKEDVNVALNEISPRDGRAGAI
jgi:hypothetical protein